MKKNHKLQDLFNEDMKELYSLESQLLDAYLQMTKYSSHSSLKELLLYQLQQSREYRIQLIKAGKICNTEIKGQLSTIVRKILQPLDVSGLTAVKPNVRDAFLISLAQKVNHYALAICKTTGILAKSLEFQEVAKMLSEIADSRQRLNQELEQIGEEILTKSPQTTA
ncbi:MAG: DUF892 family protein [Candidatus Cyclobacteriaceae bacterium M3_2C_046]